MEKLADTMAAEIAHHGATFAFRIGLDRSANCTGFCAGFDCGNATQKALIRHFKQSLGSTFDIANSIHAA